MATPGPQVQTLPVLVLPTRIVPLLVPGAAVAEVVGMQYLTHPRQAGGLVGSASWRGITLPVGSFEGLCGAPVPQPQPRSKLVVFYPTVGHGAREFFALLAISDPRTQQLGPERLSAGEPSDNPLLLQQCRFDDLPAGIPDLKAVQAALAEQAAGR